ncbi:uncharacterized protein LOC111330727 [Stylophora pistillata]|uniref:uncharacterized protein LOC111330727 n=1 Tax=Stylophora pistillata TaxID=50429 RepID=UPI000C03E34E|nr:uncharacterized protein LOC111330727 [Stylophora pistillata]XP_022791370.1 uncharacterized protein LOC111330727 [Stylophora pistillata]
MDRADPKIPENVCSGPHPKKELECDDNQSATRSTFEHFKETMDQFQQGRVEIATDSLQAAYEIFLKLNPVSFENPTDYEKEQVDRGREMCLSQSSAPPFFGAVLSDPEPIADKNDYFYASYTIVLGAVALKLHKYKIAIDLFQRCDSLFTSDTTPGPKHKTQAIDILIAVAKTNIGCVYLITRVVDKAKDYLECALEIFETFKNKNKANSLETNIVTIQTNLSLVYQFQNNYPAAVKLHDCLLLKVKDPNLPLHLVAAIHYNRAELLLEIKEPVKALMELNRLDLLAEKMNNRDGIFSKFISSKMCLAYQMAGEVACAKKMAERLIFPSLYPKSSSPPLSPSSKSSSSSSSSGSSSGSGSSSPSLSPVLSSSPSSSSSSSSSLSSPFSVTSVISSFSLFLFDFEAVLGCYGKFSWDFLFAMILNIVDFYLKEGNLDFVSFLDVFVPSCRETLGKNHPTYALFLYRQGVRFLLMERNLSSKNCFEEALSTLTSSDFGSDHPDLVQCNIGLARLLLCEDFQEVRKLKSCPDRSKQEFSCDAADGVVSPDIPSSREDSNKWDCNEELEEQDEISVQENRRGKHDDRLEKVSQKDKNRGISTSQKILETQNVACDGRSDALQVSFHGGDVVADGGDNPDALATNGACDVDKDWNAQAVAPPKPQGDLLESNSKSERYRGLKGGRRSNLSSGHGSQRDPSEDECGKNHIGIDPSFLERHSYEYNASDKQWDICGPYEDLEEPSGIHSEYNRSGYMPEVCYPTPPSSSTYPGCPDVTTFTAGDHSAFTSTTGSLPQAYLSPDGYQPQEPSLNLVLMPKVVPAKTLQLPQTSSFLEDGSEAKSKSKSKANFPLTVKEFTNDNVQARTVPNISADVHVLAERPTFRSQFEREDDAPRIFSDRESVDASLGLFNSNSNTFADESLAVLERRVAEACSLVERTLKERQEREKALKETEQKRKEERARKEQQVRERKEKEAREMREREHSSERVEGNATGDGGETPSQDSAVTEGQQWLCEHYQRLCRVKFPCCGRFFPCHRCHNNSGCPNDNSKAREACYVECSICSHQQEINQDAHTCVRCKTRFSAYFCSVCKHFTGEDKAPYHCTKCGICRIYKDRSFHCDVCNVCLDKRLEGKHSCRENSGHDECCICLEDAFSGCQILPCSHKVHRECAIAMIQNGVRSCPICRHPLYSQAGMNE